MPMRLPDRSWLWLRLTASALIVVAAIVGAYVLFFVNRQRDGLTDRGLRRLAVYARDLQSKVEQIGLSLGNIAAQPDQTPASVASRIELIPDLDAVESDAAPASLPNGETGGETFLDVNSVGGLDVVRFVHRRARKPKQDEPEDEGPKKEDPEVIVARSTVAALIGPSDVGADFDVVLVALERGTVLLASRSEHTEVVVTDLADLRDPKGEPIDLKKVSGASQLLAVNIAGEEYALYLQPVTLPLRSLSGAEKAPESTQWFVAGLVRESALRRRSFALPADLSIVFLTLLLMGILAAPHLKVWCLGDQERYSTFDVTTLLVSSLAAVGLLTILVLALLENLRLTEAMEREAEDVAERVLGHLDDEVLAAHRQLVDFFDGRNLSLAPSPPGVVDVLHADPPPVADWKYRSFDMLFWATSEGQQQEKWTVKTQTTPGIDIRDREYFIQAGRGSFGAPCFREGPPWRPTVGQANARRPRFAFDLVQSRNTGETQAMVSIPLDMDVCFEPLRGRVTATPFPDPGDRSAKDVGVIVFRPLSLIEPVLPVGLEFAILDERGDVVLRSNLPGHRQENFPVECEDGGRLRAALLARRQDTLTVTYHGESHSLHARPLGNQPWFLVVFRPTALLGTIHFEMVISSLVVFCLPLLIALCFGLFSRPFLPRYRMGWLWPDPDARGRYAVAAALGIALGAWLVAAALDDERSPAFLFVAGIPAAAVVLTSAIVRGPRTGARRAIPVVATAVAVVLLGSLGDASGRGASFGAIAVAIAAAGLVLESRANPEPGRAPVTRATPYYVALGSSLLFVLAAAPCVAIFRDAFDHGMESLTRYAQVDYCDALRRRGDRARAAAEGHDVYPSRFFDHRTEGPGERPAAARRSAAHFTSFLTHVAPTYNSIGERTRRICSGDDPRWRETESGRLDFVDALDAGAGAGTTRVSSRIPSWGAVAQEHPLGALVYAGAAFLVLVGCGLVLGGARRVLGIDRTDETLPAIPWKPASDTSENRILLRPPRGPGGPLASLNWPIVDLPTVPEPEKHDACQASPPSEAAPDGVILDRFEFRLEDPAVASKRLALLELLVFGHASEERCARGRRVVIVSDIEPLYFLTTRLDSVPAASRVAAEAELKRWAYVLSTFVRHRYPLVPRPGHSDFLALECGAVEFLEPIEKEIRKQAELDLLSEDQIAEQVGDLAEAHYRRLWSTCAVREKSVLFNLAREGFVNPQSWELVRRLKRRGLLRRDPALRLMNRSFEAFVANGPPPETAPAADATPSRKGWATVRPILMFAAVGFALFLFLTKGEQMSWIMSAVTAAAAGIPAVIRLFDVARTDRPKTPA